MKPRKVLHCQLIKALFIPGYRELNQRTINTQFHPGVRMELHSLGVYVVFQNGFEWIAPSSMLEVIVLEPLDAKKD